MRPPEACSTRRSPGTLAGMIAVAAAIAGGLGQFTGDVPVSAVNSLTLAMVFAAGALALLRPRRVEFLIGADVLAGIALSIEMFDRLGPLYLPALVVLVLATMRSRAMEEAEVELDELPEPVLVIDWQAPMPPRPDVALEPAAETRPLRRAG